MGVNNKYTRFKIRQGRRMTTVTGQLFTVLVVLVCVLALVCGISALQGMVERHYGMVPAVNDTSVHSNAQPTGTYNIGMGFGDMLSPIELRRILYGQNPAVQHRLPIMLFFYFVGIILFTGVVVSTITNFVRTFGDRYKGGIMRYHWRGHILFLGYSELMVGTLKSVLKSNPHRVVVIAVPENVVHVRQQLSTYLDEQLMSRVSVMKAVRTRRDDLLRCKVHRAHRLFIVGDDHEDAHDALNLQCMGATVGLCLKRKKKVPIMFYLRNQASFLLIQRQEITPSALQRFIPKKDYDEKRVADYLRRYCEPFNFYENMARHLLFGSNLDKTLALDWHNDEDNLFKHPDYRPHLVIIGMTEMGMALAREVAMVAHYPVKQRLLITFVDPKARREMDYYVGRHRALFDLCHYSYRNLDDANKNFSHEPTDGDFLDIEYEFIQAEAAHPELARQLVEWARPDSKELLTLAICGNDSASNMAMALYLPHELYSDQTWVPVWIYQQGDSSLQPFMDHNIYRKFKTFSLYDYGVSTSSAQEYQWARIVAADYDKHCGYNAGSDDDWFAKSQMERWSSLYNALSLIIKLRSIGLLLSRDEAGHFWAMDTRDGHRKHPVVVTQEEQQRLGAVEHQRWMVEKLLCGFRTTSAEQHDAIRAGNTALRKELKQQFVHDDIRPNEQLDAYTQAKDTSPLEALIQSVNRI